jgi:hypothetical protein
MAGRLIAPIPRFGIVSDFSFLKPPNATFWNAGTCAHDIRFPPLNPLFLAEALREELSATFQLPETLHLAPSGDRHGLHVGLQQH